MRLGIDAREIQDGVHTGIGRPLVNFLRYFSSQDTADQCVLFSSRAVPIDFGPRVTNVVIPPRWTTQYWDQVQLAAAARGERLDVFYSPYYKLPLSLRCPSVCAVLDLMYLILPEYRRRMTLFSRLYYATMGRIFLHKADRILTCSEFSKKDIVDFYRVNPAKIDVIALSVSAIFRRERSEEKIQAMRLRYGIQGPYLLYMGNFKVHKNLERVIRAFSEIAAEFAELKLVLAGPKEHEFSFLQSLARELALDQRIIFTGTICEEDEPHVLYSAAQVFVMPSLYEGFGLPPVEAMACGVPVVASSTTSMPEVVKDAGLLVDPQKIDEIAHALKRLLTDHPLRERLIAKGLEYAGAYDESKIAARQYELFKSVAHR